MDTLNCRIYKFFHSAGSSHSAATGEAVAGLGFVRVKRWKFWGWCFTFSVSDSGKYGVPHPPAFFLRPSYWLKGSSGYVEVRAGSSHDPVLASDTEPMPLGFDGKEAIR